ncbi:hypothetical protein [Streptomyces sp. R-74717]|uniref:hypothetical protein n=1 Tax=Streptomyces sp. R-74717 TaxID=2969820 RepID=UPI0039B3F0EE
MRCVAADDTATLISYGELACLTGRFANALTVMGVGSAGDGVHAPGPGPELYATVLGTLRSRRRAVLAVSAFGPEPVRQRLELGDVRVLVTTEELYRRKVEETGTACRAWITCFSSAPSRIRRRERLRSPRSRGIPWSPGGCHGLSLAEHLEQLRGLRSLAHTHHLAGRGWSAPQGAAWPLLRSCLAGQAENGAQTCDAQEVPP